MCKYLCMNSDAKNACVGIRVYKYMNIYGSLVFGM